MSQVTLSGLTPTSSGIHLGNYFGAVRQWIDLQKEGGAHYFIATYHALTSVKDPEVLAGNIFGVACDYLALGLDPEKALIYRQVLEVVLGLRRPLTTRFCKIITSHALRQIS